MKPRRSSEPDVGEAELKAARTLGVDVDTVMEAAQRLWRHTLTAERERRFGADVAGETMERAGRRGWITRELLDELRAELGI